ncbi:hypothetical protein ACTJJR_01710 [Bacillus sp. 22266]|uniref:hypothetical protein n=1 Tax=Bacillus TaxID=1386 RepID=UPI00117E7B9D|nr:MULTISPECIES: hypothetical protein [Bacillus amyloliquefaciens group]MBS0046355.1 hypothetical protein [Bacillus velezensis]MCK6099055.1 hypothetical protein [Bacillus velezensis]MCK6200104.1 hypothetical protein [Bacillus velezensis]QDP87847.1 hypothetical protein FGF55_06195 [Bacillus amyloliquefaciens]
MMAKLNGVKTLDMVNGEITKVAYGGAEYVKAEGLPKMGDLVRAEEGGYDIAYGAFYKITEDADHEEDVRFLDDVDDGRVRDANDYVLFRKVSAASVEAERLKVGEYAKVVGQAIVTEKGDIVKVIKDTGDQVPFMVETMDGKDTEWRTEESLVRATDEEVAEAKDAVARAKFKEGAKVRLKSGGGEFPLIGFENGEIYEVSDNNFDHTRRGKRIRIEGGDCFRGSGCATPDQLEILSEEEAAEIERKQAEEAKWAKIGRKVGEYKIGDVVRYDYGDNEICEVVDDTEDGRVGVQTKDYGICREKPTNLRLITPVEARFDR